MSFPEGSSYKFADSGCSHALRLAARAAQGQESSSHRAEREVGDAAEQHLLLRSRAKDGRPINSLQLAGVPDLRLAQPNATRAAAMLQISTSWC